MAELAVAALLEPGAEANTHKVAEPRMLSLSLMRWLGGSAGAANKTFEVKSNVPFSQAVQLDETPRDYPSIFGKIKTDASA